MKSNKIICWWSGGVSSAVACKLAEEIYGVDRCTFIFVDTQNEDTDTYRFKKDCKKWYGKEIKTITAIGGKYESIQSVWYKYKSLNVASGAVCSSELKRFVRERWEKDNEWNHQVFGFDINESKRAKALRLNHSHTNPIFPLLLYAYSKKDCIRIISDAGIDVPRVYKYGFLNNNCFKTGCVQGGIGYWQKMGREFPEKFEKMAAVEHELTNIKGKPVTMLKDQSLQAKENDSQLVFLRPHLLYPHIKDISMMKGREPRSLVDCNGLCGTGDLSERDSGENEINYDFQLNLFKNEKD